MIQKYKSYILLLIILVAALLRLYQLGSVPIAPDWDEAALGYNAFSILETGRDEYGKFLPVVLRSFDDYKPALYTYLIIPFINIFGLTTFTVRLPSALFGILTVFLTYSLIKDLFKKEKLALLSALLLAIAPWHIQFSRLAFETNVGLAFNVLTAVFFVKGLKRPWMLSLSAICAALAIYTYQSEKAFTPLFVLMLASIFFKELISLPKKYLLIALVCGGLTITPMAHYILTNSDSLMRAQATLAFSDKTTYLKKNIPRLSYDIERGDAVGKILDNRRVQYAISGVTGYLAHYNLNWWFVNGDLNRHHAPGMGMLYLWEFPFLFIGIYSLIFTKLSGIQKKGRLLLFGWFFLAPVPAALTTGLPHSVRTLNFLPTFQVFIAFGLIATFSYFFYLMQKYKHRKRIILKWIFAACIGFVFLFNFSYYLNQYFVQQNFYNSKEWQYGHKEALDYVLANEDRYKKIVVSDKEPLEQSYMFYLFYLGYPPEKYIKEAGTQSGGFEVHHNYRNFEFRPIDWKNEKKTKDTLYVGRPQDFPDGGKVLKSIDYLNGEPAIKIVEGTL